MNRTGQLAVLVVTTLVCGLLVAGCGNGVRAGGDAPAATPSPAALSPTGGAAEMQKLVDDAASAAAAADSDAVADR